MSDLLIKNMKMPDKATTIVVFSEGKARVFRQDIDHDEWLTAIEVPTPHGDLIDRDKASERFAQLAENIDNKFGFERSAAYTLASLFLQNKSEFPAIIKEEYYTYDQEIKIPIS